MSIIILLVTQVGKNAKLVGKVRLGLSYFQFEALNM